MEVDITGLTLSARTLADMHKCSPPAAPQTSPETLISSGGEGRGKGEKKRQALIMNPNAHKPAAEASGS